MFQVQDTANGIADQRLRLCEQFAVPMSQYPAAKQALEEYALTHTHSFSIYNPSGNYILRMDDGTTTSRTRSARRIPRACAARRCWWRSYGRAVSPRLQPETKSRTPSCAIRTAMRRSHGMRRAPPLSSRRREDSQWSRHEFFY